ncbi:MAG: DinB family protein [Acidimicrobiales bacterium]|nr:DinB family protein [Acidimicrobiales bacterium]MBO0894210.1 DinB family protein [Acidimicrobiales bacterium]
MTNQSAGSAEAAELLETLAHHRGFLRYTVRDLSDEQAAQRTTVSELCLGGLIKHVAEVERGWINFIVEGPSAVGGGGPEALAAHMGGFRMTPDDTLEALLAAYDEVANRTAEVVSGLSDLDQSQPLPEAPWFPPGARWTARRVLLHVLAETSQHAGHADIIREALDGQKTMG